MEYLNNPKLLDDLMRTDLVELLESKGIFNNGYFINGDNGKLSRIAAVAHDAPWVYTNPDPERYCMSYMLLFNTMGFIPERCLDCWKVVVMPRSFHELMCLLQLQKDISAEDPKIYCKCGIEVRDYVPRHYGGYFYTNSKEQGLERYHQVRKLVDENVSTGCNVILKRYCTEFELKTGPSNKYVRTDEAKRLEALFWENSEQVKEALEQPEWVRRHVIVGWMKFAWSRGDRTVTLYNGGQPLYTPSVTYHEEK